MPAGKLVHDPHVGQLVLDGLVRGHHAAERATLHRVVACHLERPVRAAQLLECQEGCGTVDQGV
jgi:hypothetical protein